MALDVRVQLRQKDYKFVLDDGMTLGRLRQIKHWFPDLGCADDLTKGIIKQDPEALLCLIWMAGDVTGDPDTREPNEIEDFRLNELKITYGPPPTKGTRKKKVPPTQAGTPTPDSAGETPTPSEVNG